MTAQPFEVVPDDLIVAPPNNAESNRDRCDDPTRRFLGLIGEPTGTKKTESSLARSLGRHVRGLLAAASVGALLLMAPAAADAVPVNTSPPVISGTLEYGQILSATRGTWTDTSSPIVSYEYQWTRCVQNACEGIPYATASTFKPLGSLVGLQTLVVVVATDAEGKIGVANSEETNVIAYHGPYYAVSESVVGSGIVSGYVSGSVFGLEVDRNLTCPYDCGALYRYDPETSIELLATPKPGFSFVGWSGGVCSGSSPTCLFTLNSNVAVVANFTGPTTTTTPTPALPEGVEADAPGEGPPTDTVPPPEASADGGGPLPADVARLLVVHEVRRHLQAAVRCEQARPCRLGLAVFVGTTRHVLIAQRAFTVAPGHSARVTLTLSRSAERLLARRHRLAVVAQLTRKTNGRSAVIEQRHYMLTA